MITDAQNRPSFNQSMALGAGTYVSTDSIDLLTANRNVGRSFALRFETFLTTAMTGGTSVQAQLITSANANLSSPTVIATGSVVTTTPAGTRILDVPIPGTAQRYLGVQYVIVGTYAAGTATSVVVSESDNQPYPTMNLGL